MIIDVHAHYGKWFFAIEATGIKDMLHILDKYGIKRCILSSSLAVVYDFREGNAELDQILDKDERLLGYVVVNCNYLRESRRALGRYLSKNKFVGVKMHPTYTRQPINSLASMAMMDIIEEYGVPLLLHTYGAETAQVEEAAKAHPDLKIIMGHMGGDMWLKAIEVAKRTPNTWLELCCSCQETGKVEQAVEAVGAQRMLFGSDLTLIDPAWTLGMVKDAHITAKEREMILRGNAKQLFGLQL